MFASKQRMAAWLLAAATTVGVAASAQGQREGRAPAQPQAHGVIKAVDVVARTITVSTSEGRQPAVDKTYALAKDVEVGVSSGSGAAGRRGPTFKEGHLVDLVPGSHATLVLSADQSAAEAILAEGLTLRGAIKAVDLAKNTLTVSLPPTRGAGRGEVAAPEEKTFTVAPGAEIALDDGRGRTFSIKEAKLADLVVDSLVSLRLSVDQKQVQGVLAEGATLHGLVKSVDPSKNSLTLTGTGRGADANDKALDVIPDIVVLIDDGKGRRFSVKEGKLADVPAGAAVLLKLSADQKNVASIRAEGPTLVGLIKAVDLDKNTVTLAVGRGRGENPEEKMLTVDKDAHITIEGAAGKLGDIKVEERGPLAQLRLSLDQKVVQGIQIGGGRR